jgi:uncharacterized protein YjbJ (UPF0337 family)
MTAAVPPTTTAVNNDRVRDGCSPAARCLTAVSTVFTSRVRRVASVSAFPFDTCGNRTEAAQLGDEGGVSMGDRTQRLKGTANELKGKAKATAGYRSGRPSTEAKGTATAVKGKAQKSVGKARSAAKKRSR